MWIIGYIKFLIFNYNNQSELTPKPQMEKVTKFPYFHINFSKKKHWNNSKNENPVFQNVNIP